VNISVTRFEFGDTYTIGKMTIDGIFFCYTLEDKVRSEKIKGKTAIPEGTYSVIIDRSTRFGRDMPHILNVPNFEGIRIHSGNTDLDTDGCILIGLDWIKGNFIGRSKDAFNIFFPKLQQAKQAQINICHYKK
jgi:hypothetical protein